jgi:transcription initiation factor TFIIF subunit alpha
MQQRRLKDQDQDEDEEEKEKRSRKKASELRIHDLEDDLEMSSDASDASGEDGEPQLWAGQLSVTSEGQGHGLQR